MKTRLTILKLFVILCGMFATTAAFGQIVYFWTNNASGDVATAANWTPNGVPLGNNLDSITFDGQSIGPVVVTSNTGAQTGASGTTIGLNVHLTSNQTSPVSLITTIASGASAGFRGNSIGVDTGATGQLSFGNGGITNSFYVIWGGINGQIQFFTNNGSQPVIFYPNFRMAMGGGGNHGYFFSGTGDWDITNYLNDVNGSGQTITISGPGNFYWTGGTVASAVINGQINSPFNVSGGTLTLQTADLLNQNELGNAFWNTTGANLIKFNFFNPPNDNGNGTNNTITGTITGTAPMELDNGGVKLAGANTFSGNITLVGGTLTAGSAEQGFQGPFGENNTIYLHGGKLMWSGANGNDYSGRFDLPSVTSYLFDTGGAGVSFTNGLTGGAPLTLTGAGSLTLLGANTYSGLTTVSGDLILQGTSTGGGAITVNDGGALGIYDTGAATPVTPSTLTVGSSSGGELDFNNVSNTVAAPLRAGTLVTHGTITFTVDNSDFNVIGASYPLLSWSSPNTAGTAPAVTLGSLAGALGFLSTNSLTTPTAILLNITTTPYNWTGATSTNWGNIGDTNFNQSSTNFPWLDAQLADFRDSSQVTNVNITNNVAPFSTTINDQTNNYVITSGNLGNITSGFLTKSGNGTVTLVGGANTYTGITTFKGGTAYISSLGNAGVAGDIGEAGAGATNIVFNGGTLVYTNGPGGNINRLFSIGKGGGTLDSSGNGPLVFGNSGAIGIPGSGPRVFNLRGAAAGNNLIAGSIADSAGGATALTLNGLGIDQSVWVLTGTNVNSGVTTVNAGELIIGTGGLAGTVGVGAVNNNSSVDINRTGTLTINSMSGTGSLTNDGTGTTIISTVANSTYSGGTTINAGTLQIGNGGVIGALNGNGNIVDNSTLVFDSTSDNTYLVGAVTTTGATPSGNIIAEGGGRTRLINTANNYSGWVQINANTTFQPCQGNTGTLDAEVVTNNGFLTFIRQDNIFTYGGPIVGSGLVRMGGNNQNSGLITLTGTNTYSGGTQIGEGTLVLGDGATIMAGNIVGNVTFTNNFDTGDDQLRALEFNRPDNVTFPGNITSQINGTQLNDGLVQWQGPGELVLSGNNNWQGNQIGVGNGGVGTVINGGDVVFGTGGGNPPVGTNGITSAGSGITFNCSGSVKVWGAVTGAGGLTNNGSGLLVLGGANSYTGDTYLNTAGSTTFLRGNIGGSLTCAAGTTLGVGCYGIGFTDVGTLNLAGNFTNNAGTIGITINRSLSPSNSTINVTGVGSTNNCTGVKCNLYNIGPSLVVGDVYQVFNQGFPGVTVGATPGFTVTDNLATLGSVTVLSVAPAPLLITNGLSNGALLTRTNTVTWPAAYMGLHLQVMTNTKAVGLFTNWVTYPGSQLLNSIQFPGTKTNGAVFYRLVP